MDFIGRLWLKYQEKVMPKLDNKNLNNNKKIKILNHKINQMK